ncbi:thrombospondin type 3 repeat-containing protein [Pontiellaceae bacterium B12227]|nr:thrombospondin type 3 repeat-containing protein [Pontiellaceae bacterium B12227]
MTKVIWGLIRAMLVLATALSGPEVFAAKVMMRLAGDDGQYSGFPDSYPVCKSNMDYMHYDGKPTQAMQDLFDTKTAWVEIGMYDLGGSFDGSRVLSRLRTYENYGMEVAGVFLYREDWKKTDTPGGAFPIDYRILSVDEIAAVRNAVATADPPLNCKDSLKIIQLLGAGSGAWGAGSASNFPIMSESEKEHLKLFDGVGVECHIGDHEPGERQGVITAMAAISQWTADNGKIAFVFMGGGASTYTDLPRTQRTYQYLWSEMLAAGVDYRSDDIIYMRQGAWPDGKHTPESDFDTLSHQQRWVIQSLATNGTSLFVSDVYDQEMVADTTLAVPFVVGKAETNAGALAVSAASSNPAIVPNSGLRISGKGFDRVVSITPLQGQTGSTTITFSAGDGITNMTSSFQLTVLPLAAVTAAAAGDINDAATWGGTLAPVEGDTRTWQSGSQTINMSATNTAVFHGGTFEVQAGGRFVPGKAGASLTLNRLVLNGGEIYMGNNLGLIMNLSGQQFTLNSGTLKSGGANVGRDVSFRNGSLAGNGTIDIAGTDSNGSDVEFQSTINTLGFSGIFNVAANGILNLPAIPVENASFGLNLSGTGSYANDENVALTSLVMGGTAIPPGTYAYTNFTAAHQAYLVGDAGIITVVSTNTQPSLGYLPDVTLNENTASNIAFIVGDAETQAASLGVSGFSSNPVLVPNGNFVFGGSGANRNVTLIPSPGQTGTATISLVVDDGGLSSTNSFLLTVNADPDTDGDGMTDATETSAGRDPRNAGDLAFEFNTAGWFEGWSGFANITNQAVADGALTGTTSSGDPQLRQDGFLFESDRVPQIVIKLKSSAAGILQVFWGHSSAPAFAAARRVDAAYTSTSNTWQAIIVPLSTHADWIEQTIVNLRIDPVNMAGAQFGIDWIRASDGDLDDDGIPDVDEDADFIDVPNGFYEQWAADYNLSEGKTGDDDHDGLSNIYEYGVGGNPTSRADRGHLPTFGNASNWFEHVHAERSSVNSGVGYTVEVSTNLVPGGWTTNGVEMVGIGVLDSEFNTVTNRIFTEIKSEQFIRLRIK